MPQIKILFEDDYIIGVDKPVNIPAQADKTKDKDLLSLLADKLKTRNNNLSAPYLAVIHRLDRPVGGVIVYAKTQKAASKFSDMLRLKEIRKTYLAVVHGRFEPSDGKLKHFLFKIEKLNFSKVVKEDKKGAKEALLDYQTLTVKDNLSLIRIGLHTGRHHQIRVQMSESGHPLFGDQKYGKGLNKPGQQIALWAETMSFVHPFTQKPIELSSQPDRIFPWILFDK